jgi:hypothetical protein
MCAMSQISKNNNASNIETSSKLCHCHLGHISRGGGVECIIKEEILAPLDFIDLDHWVDCIKGKYVKHIKKSGTTHTSGVLEIIHTDICGPFNVRSINDFNSFITFMDDFSRYGYIYPIRG